MSRLNKYRYVFLVTLAILSPAARCDGSTFSLCSMAYFRTLRSCAQGCFGEGNCNGVSNQLSCLEGGGILNSCVCRSDLIPVGEEYLSSCVSTMCAGNTIDIGSALNVYTEYCSSTGIPPPAVVLATTTTLGSAPSSTEPAVIFVTATVTETSTAISSSAARLGTTSSDGTWNTTTPHLTTSTTPQRSTSTITEVVRLGNAASTSGLSQADRIALGVGISIPLATLLFMVYIYLARKAAKET